MPGLRGCEQSAGRRPGPGDAAHHLASATAGSPARLRPHLRNLNRSLGCASRLVAVLALRRDGLRFPGKPVEDALAVAVLDLQEHHVVVPFRPARGVEIDPEEIDAARLL